MLQLEEEEEDSGEDVDLSKYDLADESGEGGEESDGGDISKYDLASDSPPPPVAMRQQ